MNLRKGEIKPGVGSLMKSLVSGFSAVIAVTAVSEIVCGSMPQGIFKTTVSAVVVLLVGDTARGLIGFIESKISR